MDILKNTIPPVNQLERNRALLRAVLFPELNNEAQVVDKAVELALMALKSDQGNDESPQVRALSIESLLQS